MFERFMRRFANDAGQMPDYAELSRRRREERDKGLPPRSLERDYTWNGTGIDRLSMESVAEAWGAPPAEGENAPD